MAAARVAPSDSIRMEPTGSLHSLKFNDQATNANEVGAGNLSQDDMDPNTRWIMKNIKRRECRRYVEKPAKKDASKDLPPVHPPTKSKPSVPSDPYCLCGYRKSRHPQESLLLKGADKWDPKQDTTAYPTNAFGEIEFPGFGDHVSKYVRADHQTSMTTMLKLMADRWGLEMPNLLISVTGGAKNFHMKTRLKEVFRRGLMKAALSTDAWIVTGGTNAGVMKHVGEAVRDFGLTTEAHKKVICIGVAPWGCVQEKELLIDDMGKWPALHRIVNDPKPKQSCLDPNHTHFILVDNGTQQQFAVEIPFRGKLENEIAKQKTATGSGVPVVLLVLEGGPGTLETCKSAIQNNTPAVIIKGSGRAADILAFAYQHATEKEVEVEDKFGRKIKIMQPYMTYGVEADITEMISREFGEKELATRVGWVRTCLKNKDLINIYELDSRTSTKDVDMAILKALLKANQNEVMDQLRLALSWNRIDVAKSEIFTDREWEMGQLDQVMFTAIELNRVNFVDLFLDHGVSLKDFLTPSRLLRLYNQISRNCQLNTLLTKVHGASTEARKFSLADVGHLLQELIGDYYQPYYLTDSRFKNLKPEQLLSAPEPEPGSVPQVSGDLQLHRPIQELFIWSVLMNRQELAKLFWREGNEQTAAALVANSILKALRKCTDDAELMKTLESNANEFEDLAVGVLNSCYNSDEQKAQDLLIRELENWGSATTVLIAVEADSKKFVSQTACQSLLNSIWMGKMSMDNGKILLVSSMFFFPLIWFIIRFREEEKAKFEALISSQSDGKKPAGMGSQPPLSRENTMNLQRTPTRLDMKEQQDEPKHRVRRINPFRKLMLFYTAPVIIFSLNVVSYLLFLGIYSYILLIQFNKTFSVLEGILIFWVFTIMVEECRQIVANNATSIKSKLYSYFTDSWNILDIITIVLFTTGMILRFIPNDESFNAARVVLSINLISFFFRILHIFSVNKQLGPKLVMIRRMIDDLMSFVVILMVFIVAYAIASEAILYPNQELTWELIYRLPRKAYWTIYGELFLEEIEGSAEPACSDDPDMYLNGQADRCPTSYGKFLVPILMGIYILLTNVLLLNLLIAMFSYTFQHIQDNTELYWYFQRFQLIIEYHSRPTLPPPLIVFSHVLYLCKCYLRRCCGKTGDSPGGLRKEYKDKRLEEKQLVQWENVIADAFLMKTDEREKESVENRVQATLTRLDLIATKVDDLQDTQAAGGTVMAAGAALREDAYPALYMPPELDDRLKLIEGQMVHTFKALDWIMRSLAQNQMACKEPRPQLPDPELAIKQRQQREEEEAQQDRDLVRSLRIQRYQYHFESRNSPYPGSRPRVQRYPVPDEKVPWTEPFSEYAPVVYSHDFIKDKDWADPDLMSLSVAQRNILTFNSFDKKFRVDRTSHLGKYDVVDGLPINPRGRTGITGRGSLGRWGPNHAGDPVVTRWKLDEIGNKMLMDGKPLLQFVVVQRSDNKQWALPGAICEPQLRVWDILKTDFTAEAMDSLMGEPEEREKILVKLEELSKLGEEVYRDYADDSRNTDNAWLETRVVNYHDEEGSILKHFVLRPHKAQLSYWNSLVGYQYISAGDTVDAAIWQTMTSSLSLHGSHSYFCQLVAEKLRAYF
ncbi:transient receptor potential cation channel subfamily M member-like 2 isoform X3 [Haliotis rufescens]|uniref:transient receptor potential cation channel subfamily M member-like 2 isoform X3 n=1 Tax=Haliotis rufescens TaxID=6454 RepID=UPI00201E93DF|nr:transient receptor potential cation channel subfamily M member-like 2 isoform X3 [Haliotis rufescens]